MLLKIPGAVSAAWRQFNRLRAPGDLSAFEFETLQGVSRLSVVMQKNVAVTPLRRHLEAVTGRAVPLGVLFEALTRLEKKGFLASEMRPPGQGDEATRYLAVTSAGRERLNRGFAPTGKRGDESTVRAK